MAINLLTEDPRAPSGAHWFWTRVIPEMATRLEPEERLYLLVSPLSRRHGDDGPPVRAMPSGPPVRAMPSGPPVRAMPSGPPVRAMPSGPPVRAIVFPWSNERRNLRTLSEHLYSPVRLPLSRIDVLDTPMAPVFNPSWSLVVHMKTMHAFTTPEALPPAVRAYRRLAYPRTARLADAIIINSESIRAEIDEHLHVEPGKLRLIYEAVDHDLFKPGSREAARARVAAHGITRPFVLFVSSLWPYKNCDGLLRAFAAARENLAGRQLAVVGAARDERYAAGLRKLTAELGLADDVVFVGGVPIEQTVSFYRAADVLAYPSMNETFGLPILEAMACGCPVVTSDSSSMPEIAGGAAVLCDPRDPSSIARAIVEATEGAGRLRGPGLRRARQFTWGATAAATLDVYREIGERRNRARR